MDELGLGSEPLMCLFETVWTRYDWKPCWRTDVVVVMADLLLWRLQPR